MDYSKILSFRGNWRNYQARVLERANKYAMDGKIHIVAAPGSGKTTLGIELIGRMENPALILTPSVTIREQWESRIVEAFLLEGLNPKDYISQDLKNPRVITIATYQALHSAMNRYKGVLEEDGTTVSSLESDDKIARRTKDEIVDYSDFDVITQMKECGIQTLCLDECHHLRTQWWKALEEFRNGLGNPKMIALTATPPYDSTESLWKRYIDMCGEIDEEITIPELVKEGSLCPHQDYVYFNYPTKEEIEEIKKYKKENADDEVLKEEIQSNEKIDKILLTSKGKIKSIKEIVAAEVAGFGDQLRLLILTDYIRKEYESYIGTEQEVIALGVLPFFEQLRRECANMRNIELGVLCGTIVIIPANAKEALLQAIGDTGKVTFSTVGQLDEQEYVKVNAVGDSHFLTAAVTDIFSKGYIKVLIGTKSLLGEGWDSPCINSLILASFVGSFMLSNQMRGRAIRIFKDAPQKTSNIWHLVCLLPPRYDDATGEKSGDFKLLKRRMEHFLGLHYEKDVIENGIERLSIITPPFHEEHLNKINEKMLDMSCQREQLRTRWIQALDQSKQMEVVRQTAVEESALSKEEYNKAKGKKNLATVGVLGGLALTFTSLTPIGVGLAGFCAFYGLKNLPRYNKVKTPLKRLESIGQGVLEALLKKDMLEEKKSKVVVEEGKKNRQVIYLQSASGRDKLLFANCMNQMFSAMNDQRYILAKHGKRNGEDAYYSIPDVFARNKEDAQYFYSLIKSYIGSYDLIYTRSETGKKILEQAREKSIADANVRSTTSKKVI